MPDSFCVVLTTTTSIEEAEKLAGLLVSRRLAACVQVTSISSFYSWEGELRRDPEYLLLIKTAVHRYGDVEAAIVANHSYEVPEIIQLPVLGGLDRYLAWVNEHTTEARPPG